MNQLHYLYFRGDVMNLGRSVLAFCFFCAMTKGAFGQTVTCSISDVEYKSGMMNAVVPVGPDNGVSLPAVAAQNPIKIKGHYKPTPQQETSEENATVTVSIVEWDPIEEEEVGDPDNLAVTLGGTAPIGDWVTEGVTVVAGKVYKIKAATTFEGTTAHANEVTLNVANN